MKKLLLIILLIVGCAPKGTHDFFGINISNLSYIEDFKITQKDSTTFTWSNVRTGNNNLRAYAWFTGLDWGNQFVQIEVSNKTKEPIHINPLSDECYFVDYQGAKYSASIYSRPNGYKINPNQESYLSTYEYYLPISKEDTNYIILQLGASWEKQTIVLKRNPSKDNQD